METFTINLFKSDVDMLEKNKELILKSFPKFKIIHKKMDKEIPDERTTEEPLFILQMRIESFNALYALAKWMKEIELTSKTK